MRPKPAAVVAGIIAFLLLAAVSAVCGTASWEAESLISLRQTLGTDALLRTTMTLITHCGDTATLIACVGIYTVYLMATGRRRAGYIFAIECGLGISIAHLLKPIVARARPDVVAHWAPFDGLSFPSGHSLNATVVYLSIAFLTTRSMPSVFKRYTVFAAFGMLIICIGLSRVFLGVHWPTDVMVGWGLGALWIWLIYQVAGRCYGTGRTTAVRFIKQ